MNLANPGPPMMMQDSYIFKGETFRPFSPRKVSVLTVVVHVFFCFTPDGFLVDCLDGR